MRRVLRHASELPFHHRLNQQIGAAENVSKVLAVCMDNLEELDSVNLATALHRLAKWSKGGRGDLLESTMCG